MQINLRLHGVLREILPRELKGKTLMQVQDGTTVADLVAQLGIKRQVIVAVNDEAESEPTRQLEEGDKVSMFSAVSGG